MSSEDRVRKPYVVSEDIHILLAEWAIERGFVMPPDEFFRQLRKEAKQYLSDIFGVDNVDIVSAVELKCGITKLIRETELLAVSMDRVYSNSNMKIQVARTVDESLNDCGVKVRFGTPAIEEQLFNVREKCEKIVLVDDILFSGKMIGWLMECLSKIGIDVEEIVVGIAINGGLDTISKIASSRVSYVRYYREVIDEICERDFYPGVPLSGRFVSGTKIETGAPYIYPFGRPCEWASIPKDKAQGFSLFYIQQTIRLWEEIERISNKIVRCCDLERVPVGIPMDSSRFIDHLKKRIHLVH